TDFECEMAMRRQAQLERIKIYRYQRRADDGTHSVRIGLLESVIKGSTMGSDDSRSLYSGQSESSDILLRNSSSEYINSMYAPEAVLMHRRQQAYDWECRRDLALQRLVASEASREARVEAALLLKARRMEEIEKWKRHGKAEEQRRRTQGNWLAALAFASFMCFVMDEVNLLRMKRGNLGAADSSRQGAPRTTLARIQYEAVLAQQQELERLMASKEVQELVPFLQAYFALRLNIRRRRRAAMVVMACLKSWRTAGKIMLATRKFHEQCRRIQRAWRAAKARFDRNTQLCCDRWMRFERQVLSRELSAAHPSPAAASGGAATSRRASVKQSKTRRVSTKGVGEIQLTLQERVKVALLPEQVRRQFVENELRFRRFALLPHIYAWHDAMDKYWKKVESWRQDRLASHSVAAATDKTKTSTGDDLRPPPARPPCPVHMPSDDQLLKWLSRCRKSSTSYSKIDESCVKSVAKALQR
ncbi:hypothetical protein FOZ62_028807, partial [Perkinsus olseni]